MIPATGGVERRESEAGTADQADVVDSTDGLLCETNGRTVDAHPMKANGMEPLRFNVFVENPQGATTKIHHDEEKLVPVFEESVSWPYPYAYGFVPGVVSGDGDCLDVFVISSDPIPSGTQLTCSAIALLEQWQNDEEDHDVLAVPSDELQHARTIDLDEVHRKITEHIGEVFSHDPDRTLRVGELLPASAAEALVRGEKLPN